MNSILATITLLILAIAALFASTTQATPVITDENTLKMLRNYMERYEPAELADLNNYVAIDEMRSAKRGMGPRPLRFG